MRQRLVARRHLSEIVAIWYLVAIATMFRMEATNVQKPISDRAGLRHTRSRVGTGGAVQDRGDVRRPGLHRFRFGIRRSGRRQSLFYQ